jgi:hypothetical protein
LSHRRLRLLGVLAALLTLACSSSAHAASAPMGMFALGGWSWPSIATLDRESAHGMRTWRVALDYQSVSPAAGTFSFSGYDTLVVQLAQRGITPLFVLTGCPTWSCPPGQPPLTGQPLTDWQAFATAAVRRYGHGGTFWAGHPTLPQRPATYWQVMNEVNGSVSATAYATLLTATAASIRAADPQARIVLSGLPEKMTVWMKDYLTALYAQPGFKAAADVIAVHGYTADPASVAGILDTARRIMLANGDGAKPLWITEMGWATGGPAYPFTTTEAVQAADLRASWDTLVACRTRWNLQRTYWFAWQDRVVGTSTDYWGLHDGLLRTDGTAKPALYAADEFTTGAPLPGTRGATCSLPGGTVLDTTVPDTTVSSPGPRIKDRAPAVTFGASEPGVHYECHFEGAGWAACPPAADGTWRPAVALAEGAHMLTVRAVDAQGNTDASPATASFIVDLSPPDTYVSGTWGDVSVAGVSLTLSSNEPVGHYECQVDQGAWQTCASPFGATLTAGAHTIGVRAIDLAGWPDAAPAVPWYQVHI